ncbi:HNH endonuclease [Blastococcus sp. SYSU DS0616]
MTGVHLLTYNPERWTWDDYDDTVQRTRAGQTPEERWSVGQRVRGIDVGDWVFLLRQGSGPRGLLGVGRVASEPYTDDHWSGEGGTAQYIEVDWLELLPFDELLPLERLEAAVPNFGWTHVYSSGRTVPEPAAAALLALWEAWTGQQTPGVMLEPLYEEGAPLSIASRRYERSSAARDACIKVHGCKCAVCGLVFADRYGQIGRDYIQVHHVVPLHVGASTRLVDPARDLRPVCANCHVMLHRSRAEGDTDRIMTPEELADAIGI